MDVKEAEKIIEDQKELQSLFFDYKIKESFARAVFFSVIAIGVTAVIKMSGNASLIWWYLMVVLGYIISGIKKV